MKKYCWKCKETKSIEEFGQKRSECKKCAILIIEHRKIVLANIKTHYGCLDCGESNPIVLQFDHVYGKKNFTIGSAVNSNMPFAKIIKETKLCVVRCANCHAIKTSKENNNHSYLKKCLKKDKGYIKWKKILLTPLSELLKVLTWTEPIT